MSPPRKEHVWLDGEADDFEAMLLTSARQDGMSADKKRALAAAMLAGAGVTAASKGALAAKVGKGAALGLGPKALLALGASAAVLGGAAAEVRSRGPTPLTAASPRHLTLPAPHADADAGPDANANANADTKATPRVRPVLSPSPSASPPPSLADELRLLAQTRDALARHDHASAKAHLDAHARTFPSGTFEDEARVLRIDLLAASGEPERAREGVRAYLASHPASPHAPRLRELLVTLGDDTP